MERHQVLEMLHELKLYGMRAAFDEVVAAGLKRQLSVPHIIGDLLQAEIAEKQARSVKYQLTTARAAARQGTGRLRLRRHADQRSAGARTRRRRLPRSAAQRGPDRRHR